MTLNSCEDVPLATRQAVGRSPMSQNITLSGTGSWLANTTISDAGMITRGRLGFLEGHSGLAVHATDTEELDDLEMEFRLRPGLTISIMLEGRLDTQLGDRHFTLCDQPENRARAWMVTEPTRLIRRSHKGLRTRKVHIMVNEDWLQTLFRDGEKTTEAVRDFTRSHLATTSWQPSRRVISLAEQILNPPKQSAMLDKLYVESRAIEIISEACSHFVERDGHEESPALSTRQQSRAMAIVDYIDAHLQEDIPLRKIARDLGMSIASLQRVFKTAYNRTVNDMIRERRLTAARNAMEHEGLNVGQAAYLAGYRDPANFSKAFKRQFGITPSSAKS